MLCIVTEPRDTTKTIALVFTARAQRISIWIEIREAFTRHIFSGLGSRSGSRSTPEVGSNCRGLRSRSSVYTASFIQDWDCDLDRDPVILLRVTGYNRTLMTPLRDTSSQTSNIPQPEDTITHPVNYHQLFNDEFTNDKLVF